MIQWAKNLKIGVKLCIGFAIIIIAFGFAAYNSYTNIKDLNTRYLDLVNRNEKFLNIIQENTAYVKDMAIATLKVVMYKQDTYIELFNKDIKLYDENYNKMLSMIKTPEILQLVKESKMREEAYITVIQELFSEAKKGNDKKVDELILKAAGLRNDFEKTIVDTRDKEYTVIDSLISDLTAKAKSTINIILLFSIIAVILGILTAIIITLSIVNPLNGVINILQDINEGDGDLTKRINHKSNDEVGVVSNLFDSFVSKLEAMIKSIKEASEGVARASDEISAGNQDLSQRTQEQASSLEETSSAIEELTATVKQNADNSQKANTLAVKAKDIVGEGNNVVKETIQAMDAVTQSSKKISEIINVVNDIAFQTNLLALNAAVEAARAGEQGRGFAVVAVEVRNLAQRSADAAKEIQVLINDSVEKIQNGNQLVLKTGEYLDKITESIQTVSDLVSEITAASREQSTGIEEVNRAILQMDQVTQQNASLVEESAASSEAMSGEAEELYNLASQFKVSDDKTIAVDKRNTKKSTSTSKHDFTKKEHEPKKHKEIGLDDGFEKF